MVPEPYRSRLSIILVDDGSQDKPALPVIKTTGDLGLNLKLYRVMTDIPWNQHGARNLGANVAPKGNWLFLSDIDHTLPAMVIPKLMDKNLDKNSFYTFKRLTAYRSGLGDVEYELMLNKDGKSKPHPNTFLMTKKLFWKAGGYDEDYCGCYGGDGPFRRWLDRTGKHVHLEDVHVVRWPREIIPDASLPQEMRDRYKPLYRPRFEAKGGGKAEKPTKWIRFEWERLL
jgi:glycosyltransferase involved in cell wall biosynthesis